MFKISPGVLILLLNLLHYINCKSNSDQYTISELTNYLGSCSEHFQYQSTGDFVYGKLTVPHMKNGDTVKITFQFNGIRYSQGILLPDGSSQEVINRLQWKQPITFRVDFPLSDDYLPMMLQILINDNQLCNTTTKRAGQITLKHTLNIINGIVQVYTYNINMPHFAEAQMESCGLVDREITTTPLVFGGQSIILGEYPWLAAIYRTDSSGIHFICGGSLVASKVILSAAHCFEIMGLTADKITTMLGRYHLTNSMEDGYTTHDIEKIILHPNYNSGLGVSDADLALLVMKEHVIFSKFIKPICLWGEPADVSRIVNQNGVVVSWGSDEYDNRVLIAPKKVNVEIVSAEVCLGSSFAFSYLTSSRTLCAGNRDGSGPCTGDSGGPLMLNRNGTWMVRGVVSSGLTAQDRCDLNEYTVYCDVAKHMSWLQNRIKHETAVRGTLSDICGISNMQSRTEHPWLALIYAKNTFGVYFLCTGTLVSSRSVLIPADCHYPTSSLVQVYLGRYDLSNINEKGVVFREVESILYHSHSANIVALLQMKDPVSFTQYVKPICLWSEPRDESQNLGQSITLSGWVVYDGINEISTVRMSMNVNIASFEQCQLLGHNVSATSQGLCISRELSSTGRILIMKRNRRSLLLGECKYFHESDNFCLLVYADMAEQMSWILRNLKFRFDYVLVNQK